LSKNTIGTDSMQCEIRMVFQLFPIVFFREFNSIFSEYKSENCFFNYHIQ